MPINQNSPTHKAGQKVAIITASDPVYSRLFDESKLVKSCRYVYCLNACEHPCGLLDYGYEVTPAHTLAIAATGCNNKGSEQS